MVVVVVVVEEEEIKLSYHNPESMLFAMYPCHGNFNEVPEQQPSKAL